MIDLLHISVFGTLEIVFIYESRKVYKSNLSNIHANTLILKYKNVFNRDKSLAIKYKCALLTTSNSNAASIQTRIM